ncbi:hypothetical protein [Streptomyces sp. NPDC056682]|uniref:hypothetical protein n=1 Tax=Streptomyces sp. NPDC056682 TaxID=3345909 RepID=UPI0036BC0537
MDLVPMSAFLPSGALWLPPQSIKQSESPEPPTAAMPDATAAPGVMSDHTVEHLCQLFYAESELGLCGCGNPEDVWQLISALLHLAPYYDHPAAVEELIGQPGAFHIVLSALTRADLIEHGGSIGGSWLTKKGEWCRQALGGITDWVALCQLVDEAGYPECSSNACTVACWEVTPWTTTP